LIRGEIKKGRPLIKCIWVPDDTIIAGKTVYEWARYCLVELAAKGATLDQLRDFCNRKEIPAPRQHYWGSTTWNSLLHPHCLLQYAGYGVWNVRGKTQRINPASEWVIVENAHSAIITEDEAHAILEARQGKSFKRFDKGSNRTHSSPYLLSGGMFVCERCGSNMVGFVRTKDKHYYVCNSQPNRGGAGCGSGVYVPKDLIENEVLSGLHELLCICTDPKGFTQKVNQELRKIWQETTNYTPRDDRRLAEIDSKIVNIQKAVEEGLEDTSWINKRIRELKLERDRLMAANTAVSEPLQIDVNTAISYRRNFDKVLSQGTQAEKKVILSTWIDKIKLAPESLEVTINYRIPEPVAVSMGAGTHFEAFNKLLLSSTVVITLLYCAGTKNRPARCGRIT
jgi:hypothetical protein